MFIWDRDLEFECKELTKKTYLSLLLVTFLLTDCHSLIHSLTHYLTHTLTNSLNAQNHVTSLNHATCVYQCIDEV